MSDVTETTAWLNSISVWLMRLYSASHENTAMPIAQTPTCTHPHPPTHTHLHIHHAHTYTHAHTNRHTNKQWWYVLYLYYQSNIFMHYITGVFWKYRNGV